MQTINITDFFIFGDHGDPEGVSLATADFFEQANRDAMSNIIEFLGAENLWSPNDPGAESFIGKTFLDEVSSYYLEAYEAFLATLPVMKAHDTGSNRNAFLEQFESFTGSDGKPIIVKGVDDEGCWTFTFNLEV